MKVLTSLAATIAMAVSMSAAQAAELKSGPQVGDEVGPYYVTKVAGNSTDGVEVGKSLCYRCKLGSRPVVMVFARKADENLATLVKELDKFVVNNTEKKAASFLNMLGSEADTDKAAAEADAEKFITSTGAKNIAVVFPNDYATGPTDYKISPDAEVTVLIYKDLKVAANYALPAGGLDKDAVKKIIADTATILN